MNAFVCILAIIGATTAYKPQNGWQSQDGSDGNNGWQVGDTKKGWQPQTSGSGWQGDASTAPDGWQPVEPKPWKTGGVDPQPWQIAPVVPKPWKADPKPWKDDPQPWKDDPKSWKADPKPWKSDPKPWKADPKPWKLVHTTETPKGWQDGADDSAWAWQGVGQAAALKKGGWQPEPTATAGPVGPWQSKHQTGPWKSAGNDGASSGWKNDDYTQKGWEQDSDNEVSGWKPQTDGGDAWKAKQWQTPPTWQVPSTPKPWKYVSSTKGPWQSDPWTTPTAKPWKQSSKY